MMKFQQENSSQAALDAAAIYALFVSVFVSEPDEDRVESMGLLLEAAGIEMPHDAVVGERLTQCFRDRLVVTVSSLYIPAVESCVVDMRENERGVLEPGQVDGKQMTEVSACYRLYNFDPRLLSGFLPLIGSMRPDHLIAELAFMAHLRRLQAVGGERGESTGQFADEFLDYHVRRWVPVLYSYAKQQGREDVYVRLIGAVCCWIDLDAG